jgi:hypothetical protein
MYNVHVYYRSNEVLIEDVPAEAVLLEQLQGAESWAGVTARNHEPWTMHVRAAQLGRATVKKKSKRKVDSLQVLGVLWMLEILQVVEVGDELWLVEDLLVGQVIEIGGIRKTLHKLGGG